MTTYSISLAIFFDYILLNYIENDGKSPLFPKEIWNHYNDDNGPRTNNHIEGYNLKLNNYVKTHPNIWKFITKIQSEETTASLKYIRIENNTYKHKYRKAQDASNDLHIAKCKIKYLTRFKTLNFILYENIN